MIVMGQSKRYEVGMEGQVIDGFETGVIMGRDEDERSLRLA